MLILLTLASALLPAMILPLSNGVPGWTGPTTISSTNNSFLHYSASTVQDNAGNVYLFWDQNPGIYYTVTTTGNIASNVWPTPKLYTKNNAQDIEPAPVTLKNGTLIIFFTSKRSNRYDIYYAKSNDNGLTWSTETTLSNTVAIDTGPSAMQDVTGRIWVSWQRQETGDTNIKFVDSNGNGAWDPGEPIIYDSTGSGMYASGDPLIYGTTPPAVGTPMKVDARIGFVDVLSMGVWKPGDFVVYDSNTDSIYDPRFHFVDANNNNVWDPGETIIYKANSTNTSFGGTGRCIGAVQPNTDCVIIGSTPSSTAVLKLDPHIKFVDLNGDGLWEPGETLVYDVNNGVNTNSGVYTSNDIAIPALVADPNLRFIGIGSTWTSGSPVVYDKNGNNVYDGGIMYVEDIVSTHWVPGDTVVYHTPGAIDVYQFSDTFINGTTNDIGKGLLNDPALRFVDLNGNGVFDFGEPVLYDANLNGIYDGRLMFVNATTSPSETWSTGKAVVFDADGDGRYIRGKYVTVNDTIITGTVTNNTAVRQDPLIKFYDANANTLWDPGETVVYTNSTIGSPNTYQTSDPIIFGTAPGLNTGLTTGLGETVISFGAPVIGTQLVKDPRLRYVRTGTNTTWAPGESVVYDVDNNTRYGYGKFDPNIRFVNSTTNPTETWQLGKPVVYDADGDGKYIVGKYVAVNDTVITGTVLNNTLVKSDAKLEFVDCTTTTSCDGNNRWESGEAVFYDSNGDGVYDSGEPIITGTAPPAFEPVVYGTAPTLGTTLSIDPLIKYADSDLNGIWDSMEAIVYDGGCPTNPSGCGSMQPGYAQFDLIRGTIPQSKTQLSYNTGDPWIAGPPPTPGKTLSSDPKIKFVDSNANGHWDSTGVLSTQYSTGEPVVYDTNNSGIYTSGTSIIISGSPVPPLGTQLKNDETSLAGTMAATNTRLSADPKIKYVQYGTNTTWVPGETVVYDQAGTGKYVYGKFSNDTIIAGAPPVINNPSMNNTIPLVSDTHLKYAEQISPSDGHWDIGEPVFYDTNNDGLYESNEPVVAVFSNPSNNSPLVGDSHLKYFETGTDTHWDLGESVVDDVNNTGTYVTGDPILYGTPGGLPSVGTVLSTDSKIKFVDGVGGGAYVRGDAVVYDSNNDGKFEAGEPALSGTPTFGAALRSVTHIFYRTYSGTTWSPEQRLTTLPYSDGPPVVRQSEDGRFWIAWSGQRPGGPNKILYRTSIDGNAWTSETGLTNSPADFGDNAPSMLQDRNGTLWIAFSRNLACGNCGKVPFQADVFTMYSIDNGAHWTSPVDRTNATGTDEIQPDIVQLNDKNLYLFYSLENCGGSTCTVVLNYFKTPIPIKIHDANMISFTTNATSTVNGHTYGPNIRIGQPLRLNATVTNVGDFNDTFLLTVRANSTIVGVTNSSLVQAGRSKVIFIDWHVLVPKPGRYTLTANVTDTSGAEGIPNLMNNTAIFNILVRPAGDVNGDCIVDISDLAIVGASFGSARGQPRFNVLADLDNSGVVDIADLAIVGGSFGQTC